MDFYSFWRVHWQAREFVCEKTSVKWTLHIMGVSRINFLYYDFFAFSAHLHSVLFFRPYQEVCTRRCQSQSNPAKLYSSLKTANPRKTPDMLICTTVPAVMRDFQPRQIKFRPKVLFFSHLVEVLDQQWTKLDQHNRMRCHMCCHMCCHCENQQRAAVSCLW